MYVHVIVYKRGFVWLPPSTDEVSKLTSKMQDVKDADVPVVDESVLLWDPISGTDPPSLEDSCISDWGKEVL